MYHDRKARRKYVNFPRPTGCQFCDREQHIDQLQAEFEHCLIIRNRTSYTQWELRRVVDHLMVVPRRHVLSLSELTRDERDEIMGVMGRYEQRGYDIFARAPQSSSRSVAHQHTHLIKADARPARGLIFWRRPYILKLFR